MLAGGLQLFGTVAVNPACLLRVSRQLGSFAASLQVSSYCASTKSKTLFCNLGWHLQFVNLPIAA